MVPNRPGKQVIVVGGGIFGVSSAHQLAQLGADVILVNDGPLAGGASGRSIAWLNSAHHWPAEYHMLRLMGIDRWRTFAARRPVSSEFLKFDGGLMWRTAAESDNLRSLLDHEHSIGYDAVWLMPDEIATVTPGIDISAIPTDGAIFNPGEGWVDLPSVIKLLAREFVSLGGIILDNAGKSNVTVANGKATGVKTANGQLLESDAVLLATGDSVPFAMKEFGIPMGDDTPVSLLVFTEPAGTTLKAVLNTPRVAIRPTPDGALALDSEWAEKEIILHEDGSFEYLDSTVQGLLDEATRVLDGNPVLRAAGVGAGRKPIPGGGEPVVGELDQISDFYVAFSHSGATQGLFIPELLAREIVEGVKSPLLAKFRPGKYSK